MTTNGDSGGWKYGVGCLIHPRWAWFKVKEDGTGHIYELRPADILRGMDPMPGVNSEVQFTLKEDNTIDEIKCYERIRNEEEKAEEEANEGEANEEETDDTG